jgi:hypothetical protein
MRDADLLQAAQLRSRHPLQFLCADAHNIGLAVIHPWARIEPTSAFDPYAATRAWPLWRK